MKRRNILLFAIIVVAAIAWGAVYWYFVMPIIDPR
ncbi:YdgA family protein [Sporosarcina beigongshangi]|nr:YdgA family protein [Sporosarcina beigongshangi]